LAEVLGHCLGVSTQRHRRRRANMKALADCTVSVGGRELECLRNIVSVNVMNGFHPEVGKRQLFTIFQALEHCGIEMSRRIEWWPTATDDVSGMQYGRSNQVLPHCLEQPFLDCRLFDSVVAEWIARLGFSGRNYRAVPMDPDRTAVKEQYVAVPQRLNQMLRALDGKANEVDDDVWAETGNTFAKGARRFFSGAVDVHSLDSSPRGIGLVRLADSATRDNYLVSRGDESRNEVGADMASAADDDDFDGRMGWSESLALSRGNLSILKLLFS
jgi:hypothetical protein